MRKKLLIVIAAVAALLGTSLAVARADLGDAGETVGEKTGAGPLFESAMGQLGVAADGAGEGAGSAYQVAAQSSTTGSFSFFPDQEMPCALDKDGLLLGCGQTLEPEVKSAPDGSIFVTAQAGTPDGVLAWRRDPGTFAYKQLDKPDGVPVAGDASGITGGGGDNELAISAPDANGRYRVYVSSLMSLATNGVAVSTDRGDTWLFNPVASNFVGVDRQWLAASGEKTVYLAYHQAETNAIFMDRSDDGGLTWGPPMPMFDAENMTNATNIVGGSNWEGNLVALPDGGVAFAYIRSAHADSSCIFTGCPRRALDDLWVAVTDTNGANPRNYRVGHLPTGAGVLFPSIAVDSAGNLYAIETNGHQVYLSHSLAADRGAAWSPLVDVAASAPAGTSDSSLFPYVVAGSPGKVAMAWLGAGGPNAAGAQWTTQFAETTDGLADNPTFTVQQASNHIVHTGAVCVGGIGCNAADPTGSGGRELAEVLQMGITKDGRVLIAYPDNSDGAHFSGWAWVVEQNQGPGLYDNVTPSPPTPPVLGHTVANFTASGPPQTLYFTNASDGLAVSPVPGLQFDGTTIAGALSSLPGSKGHVGVIGYAANAAPGVAKPVVFETRLTQDVTLGQDLWVDLYVQNELADQGASELDFSLIDVGDGSSTAIIGRPTRSGDPLVGGMTPTHRQFHYDISGGYFLPAGHTLRMEMLFPYAVSSTTRFYYGDPTNPAGITFDVGSGS